ncbi:diacylglycerol kinase family enzyme [Haloferula luteola]|uniref:Diacylglycerol kinase family enzyme n=1 Tax=Haloferula luteola TaxID=595692 RepID=A0A840VG54_9BACT|nr:diacylglycerol kinase family protein [Haloferula luteola]MBB5351771.1 diacylglycerol kinase family enzyme [Haloferula luteola]
MPPTRRHFEVVLNRESGTLRDLWHEGFPDELAAAFREGGADVQLHAGTAKQLDSALRAARQASPDAVIVGGGDGTVSHAAAQLVGTEMPMGILPCGTFNLAARDLGIPLDVLEAARALGTAPSTAIDVLDAGGRISLCNLMLGFYPAMARQQEEFHGRAWWRKTTRILVDLRKAFHDCPPLRLDLDTDERGRITRTTRFAALVPGEYEDILSLIPRRQIMDGGTLGIYLSHHRTLPSLVRGMFAYLFGLMEKEPELELLRSRGLTLTSGRRRTLPASLDGEILDIELPLRLDLRPGALHVLRPGDHPD